MIPVDLANRNLHFDTELVAMPATESDSFPIALLICGRKCLKFPVTVESESRYFWWQTVL